MERRERVLGGVILGVGIIWLVIGIILQPRLPQVVPFFYSLPWGEEQLAPRAYLIFANMAAVFVMGLNILLSRVGFKTDKFLGRIFLWTNTVVILLTIVTISHIWSIFL